LFIQIILNLSVSLFRMKFGIPRALYKDRWTIKNQGIRYLSQRWSLRDLAGRGLNSIQARIFTILILYNAVKILQMKYEDQMDKLQEEMRERGELSYLLSIINPFSVI